MQVHLDGFVFEVLAVLPFDPEVVECVCDIQNHVVFLFYAFQKGDVLDAVNFVKFCDPIKLVKKALFIIRLVRHGIYNTEQIYHSIYWRHSIQRLFKAGANK